MLSIKIFSRTSAKTILDTRFLRLIVRKSKKQLSMKLSLDYPANAACMTAFTTFCAIQVPAIVLELLPPHEATYHQNSFHGWRRWHMVTNAEDVAEGTIFFRVLHAAVVQQAGIFKL